MKQEYNEDNSYYPVKQEYNEDNSYYPVKQEYNEDNSYYPVKQEYNKDNSYYPVLCFLGCRGVRVFPRGADSGSHDADTEHLHHTFREA